MSILIDLQGRKALVTGASGKLGGVIAKMLATAGADVALHYFSRREVLEPLAEEIKTMGRNVALVSGDIGSAEGVNGFVEQANAGIGTLDIVVANAVVQNRPWLNVVEEDPAVYVNQFNSCVMQAVYLTQATVPAMRKNGWGRFIGISTECIMQLYPTHSAYVSAKRGMDGVLRVLANEVASDGVTVNQVAPGWIAMDEAEETSAASQSYIAKNSPMKRRASPEDVAHCVSFLASSLARSITGSWVPVSCGSVQPRV